LLVEEAARRRRIESRFVSLLESAGHEEVLLPIIDYVEPYTTLIDRDAARQSYRFVDREGELVAIRSDFTPMVARALAPALPSAELPLRVFYRGDVIRVEATRLGVNREMFQIGAEVIGDDSVEADVTAMKLAASCLADFGLRPLVVYNDVSIARTLTASAEATPGAPASIRSALLSKRTSDLEDFRAALAPSAFALIERLASGVATLDDVAAVEPCSAAAERLRAIDAGLRAVDTAEFVLHLDDIDGTAAYYSGLRFRIYGHDARTRLAQGGRYDDLYGRFGTPAAAIGFTFTIDDVDEDVSASEEPNNRSEGGRQTTR
jgi:ATP phosphoribosyltransferase regulatory subunit